MKYCLLVLAVVAASPAAVAEPATTPAALFHQGQTAYDLQHYDEALTAWEQSYALSRAPALLYNIAQAYRLRGHVGDCALARADYAKFIELAPPSPERDLAAGYVAQLAACANPPTEPNTVTTPVTPRSTVAATPSVDTRSTEPLPHSTATGRSIVPVALGVAGIGLLATGIAFGHHASILGDDVTHACSVSCDWSGEATRDAAGRRDAAVGWVFDGVGAAALVGSAALFYLAFREHGIVITPAGTSIGAAVVWTGAW